MKISIDHMYLRERKGNYRESNENPPRMIMVDHRHGRCCAYRVPNKVVFEESHWLPERMVQDLDNNGMRHEQSQMKVDQEPAIVAAQEAIMELRPNVIPTNSPVGESECNGRVENAIRRIQEKFRAFRHQVEQGIGEKIPDDSPVMSWLVRWAADVISKYALGDDGRTPFERIRREVCAVPLVLFGGIVVYLPLHIAAGNNGEPVKKQGVWLGTIERIEEALTGTSRGAAKCRTVS